MFCISHIAQHCAGHRLGVLLHEQRKAVSAKTEVGNKYVWLSKWVGRTIHVDKQPKMEGGGQEVQNKADILCQEIENELII